MNKEIDDEEDFGEFDFEGDDFDCHMDPIHGGCELAGTEECDFECPYRDEQEF